MGVKYLWDTNTVIYYLQQQFSQHAEKLIDGILKESVPCISAITEIELLCWKHSTETDKQILLQFISDAVVIELEKQIRVRAANLRSGSKMKLPDAIIAATAIEYRLKLITRNVSDFYKVPGLVVVNPWEY